MTAQLKCFPIVAPLTSVGVGTFISGHPPKVAFYDSYNQTRDTGRAVVPHGGIDIMGEVGLLIVSSTSGTVRGARWQGLGGWHVEIAARGSSGSSYTLLYAHMATPPFVKSGDSVRPGTLLGVLGQTGGRDGAPEGTKFPHGPHLHFSSKQDGVSWNPYSQLASLVQPIRTERGFWALPSQDAAVALSRTLAASAFVHAYLSLQGKNS